MYKIPVSLLIILMLSGCVAVNSTITTDLTLFTDKKEDPTQTA